MTIVTLHWSRCSKSSISPAVAARRKRRESAQLDDAAAQGFKQRLAKHTAAAVQWSVLEQPLARESTNTQHTLLLAHVTQSSVYNESVFLVLLHLRGYIIEGLRRCRERQRPLHLLRLLGQEVGVLLWEGEEEGEEEGG